MKHFILCLSMISTSCTSIVDREYTKELKTVIELEKKEEIAYKTTAHLDLSSKSGFVLRMTSHDKCSQRSIKVMPKELYTEKQLIFSPNLRNTSFTFLTLTALLTMVNGLQNDDLARTSWGAALSTVGAAYLSYDSLNTYLGFKPVEKKLRAWEDREFSTWKHDDCRTYPPKNKNILAKFSFVDDPIQSQLDQDGKNFVLGQIFKKEFVQTYPRDKYTLTVSSEGGDIEGVNIQYDFNPLMLSTYADRTMKAEQLEYSRSRLDELLGLIQKQLRKKTPIDVTSHLDEAQTIANAIESNQTEVEGLRVLSSCKLVLNSKDSLSEKLSSLNQMQSQYSNGEIFEKSGNCIKKGIKFVSAAIEKEERKERARIAREERKERAREAREERRLRASWAGRISRAVSMCYKINAYKMSRNRRALYRIQDKANDVLSDASEAISEMQYRDVSQRRIYGYMRRIKKTCRGY
jgi:hypothetical protein